ncbi:MAG: hypothetical protein KKA64_00605 [Nanoarchaeota archaeon]|nr:hypothetical protein [Nanoarchaeota archaeon]
MARKVVLLDTNFILTCVKQKIDFFSYLEEEGFQILIPSEVIKELEKISLSKQKLRFRDAAKLSLGLLNKNKFKRVTLNAKNTDLGIINFAKQNPKLTVATLDRDLKNKITNKKLIIRGKKKLEIV